MKSHLLGAVSACLIVLSFNANAVIVDNGTYTTVDGVDWLDLTATVDMSYNDVTAQLGPGGTLEGWSYASRAQVEGLWTAFGGDPTYYNGWSTQNNGLFDVIAPLFGDLFCEMRACVAGDGYSFWTIVQPDTPLSPSVLFTSDLASDPLSPTQDSFSVPGLVKIQKGTIGSALVRTSAVPVPAAVWLFGSGLLGLIGMARRKA